MSGHDLAQLLHSYGLGAVFLAAALQALGPPVPAGTVLVLAALDASRRHGLPLVGIIACGAAGAFLGTTGAYLIGRRGGEPALLRLGRLLRQRPETVAALRERYGAQVLYGVFAGRFLTGVRNVIGLVAGASGVPAGRFLAVNAAAAGAWATLITLEYFFFGHALSGLPTWLTVLLVLLAVVLSVGSLTVVRRRALPGPSEIGRPPPE